MCYCVSQTLQQLHSILFIVKHPIVCKANWIFGNNNIQLRFPSILNTPNSRFSLNCGALDTMQTDEMDLLQHSHRPKSDHSWNGRDAVTVWNRLVENDGGIVLNISTNARCLYFSSSTYLSVFVYSASHVALLPRVIRRSSLFVTTTAQNCWTMPLQ